MFNNMDAYPPLSINATIDESQLHHAQAELKTTDD
jgi:hypothetical protein